MDNKYDNEKNKEINSGEELEETWENIRLPENMIDNSYSFKAKK